MRELAGKKRCMFFVYNFVKIVVILAIIIGTFPVKPLASKDQIRVKVGDQFLPYDVLPVLEENTVLIPMRTTMQRLGFAIKWDGPSETATATRGRIEIEVTSGKNLATVNGDPLKLAVSSRISRGRMLIPLSLIQEGAGEAVIWDSRIKTVNIIRQVNNEYADAIIGKYKSQGPLNGAVLIARGDKVILSKGYGLADREKGIPNTPKTKFLIGSLTKQFTAVAIMQLQEKGLLDIGDPLTKYFPDYPEWKGITLYHLLSHTSGLADYTTFFYLEPDEILPRVKEMPLQFESGKKFSYCNTGYYILGRIIEKVSGKSYGQYLNDNIFKPLHMVNSGYKSDVPKIPGLASGYIQVEGQDGQNSTDNVEKAGEPDLEIAFSAGGVYSTIEDLYLYDRALYTEKLLKKSSLEKIFTPGLNNYGYGWYIEKTSEGKRKIRHHGYIPAFITDMFRYVDDDTVIVTLINLYSIPPVDLINDFYQNIIKGKLN